MSADETDTMPRFAHGQDAAIYERNVAAGNEPCARCDGCGNELYSMYRACSDCGGTGVKQEVTNA